MFLSLFSISLFLSLSLRFVISGSFFVSYQDTNPTVSNSLLHTPTNTLPLSLSLFDTNKPNPRTGLLSPFPEWERSLKKDLSQAAAVFTKTDRELHDGRQKR